MEKTEEKRRGKEKGKKKKKAKDSELTGVTPIFFFKYFYYISV